MYIILLSGPYAMTHCYWLESGVGGGPVPILEHYGFRAAI